MQAAPVEVAFLLRFSERLKASFLVTTACGICVAWWIAFPILGAFYLAASWLSGHVALQDAGVFVFSLAFMPLLLLWKTWRLHRAAGGVRQSAYIIDGNGIRARSAHTEVSQDWAAIRSVTARHGFLLLFMTKRWAHCIPLRLLDAGQIASVAHFAGGKWTASRAGRGMRGKGRGPHRGP